MTRRVQEDQSGGFTARRIATTGHEILDPAGTVVAWTTDGPWAAVLVSLLNGTAGNTTQGRPTTRRCKGEAETARRAIKWLSVNTPLVTIAFPEEPPDRIWGFLGPYFLNTADEAGELVRDGIVRQIEHDYPECAGVTVPEWS
jgi:hypothetical protein